LDIDVGGQRLDHEIVALALDQVDRAAADRAGRAQDRDMARAGLRRRRDGRGLHCHGTLPSPSSRTAATNTAAATSPSMRSRMPPWPGRIEPLSFTPKYLFTADSAMSPICDTGARIMLKTT